MKSPFEPTVDTANLVGVWGATHMARWSSGAGSTSKAFDSSGEARWSRSLHWTKSLIDKQFMKKPITNFAIEFEEGEWPQEIIPYKELIGKVVFFLTPSSQWFPLRVDKLTVTSLDLVKYSNSQLPADVNQSFRNGYQELTSLHLQRIATTKDEVTGEIKIL
ncbi:MAG: hypothetical protein LBU03_04320 [Tannerellaceae bacterium]|jgi:hypothetical protein|nr:hypothetical protein [Tannerellaceae bacterium]